MRFVFARGFRARKPVCRPRALTVEVLEDRAVPALTIQFDYSRDLTGFFNDPTRRAVLQQAADDLTRPLDPLLAALARRGEQLDRLVHRPGYRWPDSGLEPDHRANTLLVYVGGRDMSGSQAAAGGNGGYSASGTSSWLSLIRTRNASGFAPWGGSLAFDISGINWYFGSSAAGIGDNQIDFYSVAIHELGHVLGLGTAPQWFSQVSNGSFVGPNAMSVYGGPVPLNGDNAHWVEGLTVGGSSVSLDPMTELGRRVGFSSLDYAALRDLGWMTSSTTTNTAPVSPPASPPPPTNTPTPTAIAVPTTDTGPQLGPRTREPLNSPGVAGTPLILTGDGLAQVFALGTDGNLLATGRAFAPFAGFSGTVRATVGDFNGDGTLDYAFGTGPGTPAQVRIIDGRTGLDLAAPTVVFEGFGGGVFLSAGDLNRDGVAELAISADAGGGNRVSVYQMVGGFRRVADFMAFNDPAFRGGSRVAMGDVNRDGVADLIVGAGTGGGPRVAIYDGQSLLAGGPVQLVPDFFALDPGLRSGVYVSAADLDGDGFADVIYSTGTTGGPRVRVVGGATLTANPGRDAYFLPAVADFFALDPADRNGIRVAARDLTGDGKAEVIVAGGTADQPQVRVVTLAELQTAGAPTGRVQDPTDALGTSLGLYVG